MLPLLLQLLAAWLAVWFAHALQQQVDYLVADRLADPSSCVRGSSIQKRSPASKDEGRAVHHHDPKVAASKKAACRVFQQAAKLNECLVPLGFVQLGPCPVSMHNFPLGMGRA